MELKIKVFQNEEGIFAEVLDENNKQICIGAGDSPYTAIKDVCTVLEDIMNLVEEKENESILKLVKERDKNDDGTRYTLEEVERMREQWK